jgi:hypothetical protein
MVQIRQITEKLNRGEGTIGKLLADDTVYKDLRDIMSEGKLAVSRLKEAADQERLGAILKAQGEKQSTILKAEGDAKQIELVALAQAEAVKVVSEAANAYFKENAQLNKRLDVIRDTFSQQTKIIVPSGSEILNVIGLEGAQVLPIKTQSNSETKKV